MDYDIKKLMSKFKVDGNYVESKPYGSGHINDTFLVVMDNGVSKKYILQRINHDVFKNPVALMKNVERVTAHIRTKVEKAGCDVNRNCLNLFPTHTENSFFVDSVGNYWRVYQFVENSIGYEIIDSPDIAYEGGKAFGQFQTWLVDLPGEPLSETIPYFNHPEFLINHFDEVLIADTQNRASSVKNEINLILDRAYEMQKFIRMENRGELLKRITHNDTKISNVLMDTETNKALCVIDVDTVMPGFALNDYGDSIRTATNTGAEDDPNLENVSIDMSLFTAYTKGYLKYAKSFLTEQEKDNLAFSGKLYPFLIGVRFLTDYLDGDHYFKIHHKHHNLQRARAQFKLLTEMEKNFNLMDETVQRIYNSLEVN